MGTLGFDDYVNPLKMYLTKYRQTAKADKTEKAGRGRAVERDGNHAVTNILRVKAGLTTMYCRLNAQRHGRRCKPHRTKIIYSSVSLLTLFIMMVGCFE